MISNHSDNIGTSVESSSKCNPVQTTCIYMYMYMYVHVHVHTCIYMYIHVHVHVVVTLLNFSTNIITVHKCNSIFSLNHKYHKHYVPTCTCIHCGIAHHPCGIAHHPCGIAHHPCGIAHHPCTLLYMYKYLQYLGHILQGGTS